MNAKIVKDSLILVLAKIVNFTPELSMMEDSVVQISAHRDRRSSKTVPVKTARTSPEPFMKVRGAETRHAQPEKFSKSTEGALLVTHTPEPPKMERLASPMAVLTDRDSLLMASAPTAQPTLEPKETAPNAVPTLATSDKGSWRTVPASTVHSTVAFARTRDAVTDQNANHIKFCTRMVLAKNAPSTRWLTQLTEPDALSTQPRRSLIQFQHQLCNSPPPLNQLAALPPAAMFGAMINFLLKTRLPDSTSTRTLEISDLFWATLWDFRLPLPLLSRQFLLHWMLFERTGRETKAWEKIYISS